MAEFGIGKSGVIKNTAFYIVNGRIPFDDEDSTKIIEAKDCAAAIEEFKQLMLEEDGAEPTELDDDGSPIVYINSVISCETEPKFVFTNY